MNHIPIAISAYLLNGIAVTIDKFLLVKHIPNPLMYIFFFSLVSTMVALLLPFVPAPAAQPIILASISTLLWTAAAYLMFHALKIGQVSRVIPIVGTLNPVILLAVASISAAVTISQTLSVALLIAGMVFLTLNDWNGDLKKNELALEIISAVLFALSYLILHQAYQMGNFLSIFVWSRPILIPVGIALLAIPKTRQIILNTKGPKIKILSSSGALFALGQISAGIAELMLIFAVSLANPALVNSLQGTQYAFLFILSLILARKFPEVFEEKSNFKVILSKLSGVTLIAVGLYMLSAAS